MRFYKILQEYGSNKWHVLAWSVIVQERIVRLEKEKQSLMESLRCVQNLKMFWSVYSVLTLQKLVFV